MGGTRRSLLFRVPLSIEFDNGSVQREPLDATVFMPSLRLATDLLDFGVCLVGQTRELPVFMSNPTGSDSYWHCKQGTLQSTVPLLPTGVWKLA